jgi:CheY-like chemotaxis protein/ketosteroid isomerase-like protein
MDTAPPVPPRILLVEPDVSMRALLGDLLSQEGYALSMVSSLEEVSAQLEEETFALVLADVFVGRTHAGSFTPAHQLRRLARPTPVGLLMTLPFLSEETAHAGFAFVLPMPFELEDLLAQVATTVQQTIRMEDQQRIQVVEHYFAAREQEDWQTVLDLCTEDVVFYPLTPSNATMGRRIQGQAALRTLRASAASSAHSQTFLHFYYAALPKGLVVRYLRLWTTPMEERRREVKTTLFHFRGAQICQVGMRPLLRLQGQSEAG